jgi:hypothetical protein
MVPPPFQLDFYEDESGSQPVRQWLITELSPDERRTVGAAMHALLQQQGIAVCSSEFGLWGSETPSSSIPDLSAALWAHRSGRKDFAQVV